MKKTFLLFFLALVARAYPAQSDLPPLYTVIVDSHRCLVFEPDHLPQNAPLVVLLHGYLDSATGLTYFWSELHLAPVQDAWHDVRVFLEGMGCRCYHRV